MRFLLTILVLIVITVVILAYVVLSGVYDVTAIHRHGAMMERMMGIAGDRAVRRQAKTITVPPLGSTAQLATGFLHYDEMCVVCHGAPGILHSEIGEGLYPPPPDLKESVKDFTPAELYWIVKTGFKDTGMPAFGPTHSEQDLWAITSFLLRLPNMTPAQYDSLRHAAGLSGHGDENQPMEGMEGNN